MMETGKIIKYTLQDLLRSRITLSYAAFLLIVGFVVFNLDVNVTKGILSLVNVILLVVPLVSIIFSTIHMYNSSEFTELLLARPLMRKSILTGQFLGLSAAMSVAVLLGLGVPVLLYSADLTGITLIFSAVLLTIIFVSIAMLAAVATRDKAKGIGISILLWFFFTLIYDGIVLWILFRFNDYPLENPMLLMTALNPVDLTRILLLLEIDLSAFMGYTGALYKDHFGTSTGIIITVVILLSWIIIPMFFAVRIFSKKDI
jgi:Cu-processing system permease protein